MQRTKSASGRRSFQFAVSRENCVWDNKKFLNKSSVFKGLYGIEIPAKPLQILIKILSASKYRFAQEHYKTTDQS